MSDKIKVAIYCRLACADKEMIEHQKTEMLAYAKEHGYGNITVYSDNGYSGTNFNRPAFKQMESDIDAGEIGLVISKNISRISRDYIETIKWLNKIERSGTSFMSVSDGVTGPFLTAMGNTIQQAYRGHRAQRR